MKQVINGKVYNTETATKIGSNGNGFGPSDFHYLWEALYITKKGAFFLHRDGGAASSCSRASGGGRFGDERLEAVSKAEALQWCEHAGIGAERISDFFEIDEA